MAKPAQNGRNRGPIETPTPSPPHREPLKRDIGPKDTRSGSNDSEDLARQGSKRLARSRTEAKPGITRQPSVQTRYMNLLLSLDEIPRLHNIFASFFTWILLAGYIVFPGTFTSLEESGKFKGHKDVNAVERIVLNEVRNAPLLWVAGACCIIGVVGMIGLWIKWRKNPIWLINRIFLYVHQNAK